MKSKNTKIDKIEILNQQISDLQVKSVNLEQQNSQLKNDKHELQMQVQDLLKMIQHINPGVWNDENFHKRFKLTESDETDAKPSIKCIILTYYEILSYKKIILIWLIT